MSRKRRSLHEIKLVMVVLLLGNIFIHTEYIVLKQGRGDGTPSSLRK